MPMADNTSPNDAVNITRSPTLNRLSHIFQLASSSKVGTRFLRPSTAPGKNAIRHRKRQHESGISSVDISSSFQQQYASVAASNVSVTDTLLTTPNESLLSSTAQVARAASTVKSIPPSPSFPSVAISQNEVVAEEKMEFIKKVRKLSRVLGDFPVVVTAEDKRTPETTYCGEQSSPLGDSPSTLVSLHATPDSATSSRDTSLRRSITVGHAAGDHVAGGQEIHHAKSFASLRPTLNIPSTSSSSQSSPISPLRFASSSTEELDPNLPDGAHTLLRPAGAAMSSSISVVSEPTGQGVTAPSQSLSRQHSCSSVSPPNDMRSATKVPPAILLHSASPPPPNRSPISSHSHAHLPSTQTLPPDSRPSNVAESLVSRTKSFGRRRGRSDEAKKRLSLDLHALKSTVSAPLTSPGPSRPTTSPGPKVKGLKGLRKSKSMWVRKQADASEPDLHRHMQDLSPESSPLKDTFDSNDVPSRPSISERERILNVRRARKMTQLFGDNPPLALFQIAHVSSPTSDGDTDQPSSQSRPRRDSLATIISISSSISASLSSHHLRSGTDALRVRDSYISISSIVTSSSLSAETQAVVAGPIVVVAQDGPMSALDASQPTSTQLPSEDMQPNSSQADLVTTLPSSSSPPSRHSSVRSRPSTAPVRAKPELRSIDTSSRLVTKQVYYPPPSPPSPIPFSDVCIPSSDASGPPEVPSETTSSTTSKTEFHARQKRAAKLSKFFGVGLNDLADVLPSTAPATKPNRHMRSSSIQLDSTSEIHTLPPLPLSPMRVEVAAAKGRKRFLGSGEEVKELDMNDAIEKLRRMKST
ncbi:hypothetical protein K474DRAFT_1770147 [Panus rudis PR-1116 ss-1]|nr:hypothetical protein K474DRAFT_1770147 [Panus rudis PR-1116 ss-1]